MIGFVYYIFPVEVSYDEYNEIKDVVAIDNLWQWKYFEWLFWGIWKLIDICCEIRGIDPMFPIYIPKNK